MEKNQGAIFCGVKRSFSPPTLLMALRLLCFMFTLCFCDIVIPSPHPFEGRWPLTVFRSFGWQLFNTTLPMVTLSTVSSEKQTNFFFFFFFLNKLVPRMLNPFNCAKVGLFCSILLFYCFVSCSIHSTACEVSLLITISFVSPHRQFDWCSRENGRVCLSSCDDGKSQLGCGLAIRSQGMLERAHD